MPDLSRPEQAMKYLIAACGGQVSRTRLVKLLYMVDHECHRYLGKALTGLNWERDNYGPFDDEGFYSSARNLQTLGLLRESQDLTAFGNSTYTYHDSGGPAGFDFTPAESRILRYVVAEFGRLGNRELIDDVVYQTKPFLAVKDAPRGASISFESVELEQSKALGGIDVETAVQNSRELREGRGVPLREMAGELLR